MRAWRRTATAALGLLALAAMGGAARAEYSRSAPAARDGADDEGEGADFSRAVDLQRFRKGSIAWDTQELIESGLTALHEEHQQILRELEDIKRRITHLEEK